MATLLQTAEGIVVCGEAGTSAERSRSRGPDTYAIKVWNSTTPTYYQLASPTSQQLIDGGNIQVRP